MDNMMAFLSKGKECVSVCVEKQVYMDMYLH